MPLWIYWALFFAAIGLSLLLAAWLDAREAGAPGGKPKPAPAFERPAARAVRAIDAPAQVDPFALTLEIDRSQALGGAPEHIPPPEREDDGPTRE